LKKFSVGADYAKKFYAPRYYRSTHSNAQSICHSYGMNLLMIETLEEFYAVRASCKANANLFGDYWTYVDGMTPVSKSPTEWYFTRTGNKVPYTMKWAVNGNSSFLDDRAGVERCLTLGPKNVYEFNDEECTNHEFPFLCERRATFKKCH
jgi:hypothetical protein